MYFSIDRDSKLAVYRQIMSGITSMVRDNKLAPGDKLPSERELAEILGASRGTVKKAYNYLSFNGVVQTIIGSGTFISMEQETLDSKKSKEALSNVEGLITNLLNMGFSYREIESHFKLIINKYRNQESIIKIAIIDCSPEASFSFEQQLGYIPQIEMNSFLLESIDTMGDLAKYDLILTTSTHYKEIVAMIPKYKSKILRAVLSPDRQTVIELAQIPKDKTVGVICVSKRYSNVIKRFMTRDVAENNIKVINEDAEFEKVLNNTDYLILPPNPIVEDLNTLDLEKYTNNSGKIIHFNYQLERGSIIYIEEKISQILKTKQGSNYDYE